MKKKPLDNVRINAYVEILDCYKQPYITAERDLDDKGWVIRVHQDKDLLKPNTRWLPDTGGLFVVSKYGKVGRQIADKEHPLGVGGVRMIKWVLERMCHHG